MVKELVVYPDDRILATADVRGYDESLHKLLDDIKETMEYHNLEALSAMQVAHPFNLFVMKKDGEFLEFVNPRILIKDKPFEAEEESSYYPEVKAIVPRYEKLKVVYEDRFGNTKYLDIDGDKHFAALFQQMMDFCLGGTMLDRIDKNQKQKILDALAGKGLMPQTDDVCPLFSKKDYFVSFTDKVLFFMGLSLFSPLFNFKKETLENIYLYDKLAFPAVILLMIGFFIYAWYESKKYRQCSSCQIGNNIGVIIKRVSIALVFAIASYFIIGKNL